MPGTLAQRKDVFRIAEEVSLRTDRRFREGTVQGDLCACLLLCMYADSRHG